MKSFQDSPPTLHEDLNEMIDEIEASYQPGVGFKLLIRIAAILAAVLLVVYACSRVFSSIVV